MALARHEGDKQHQHSVSLAIQVAAEMTLRPAHHQPYEQEYVELDGLLHTRRLIEAHVLKSTMDESLVGYTIEPASPAVDGLSGFELSTSASERSDSSAPFFILSEQSPLGLIESTTVEQYSSTTAYSVVTILIRAAVLRNQNQDSATGKKASSIPAFPTTVSPSLFSPLTMRASVRTRRLRFSQVTESWPFAAGGLDPTNAWIPAS
ncbi:hypothetical protein B0H66DRAFT_168509 [Apodospora peruviana]|uniref:Uncharacterized protein n=1 Tax=Apodospora peruviana TaxID=516989 RepID=A0AAE0MBW5_9PEZI|nr:hypothetical protein B0H66DRAFT_168509 [Apodospora peruviana]